MHVGGVLGLRAARRSGFDYDRLVQLIRRPHRLRPAVPAAGPLGARPHRQPGLGGRRALRRHLPRTALGAAQAGLGRAAARAGRPHHVSRPLDRNRPLWEMYLVEGLRGRPRSRSSRKTHHAMVDGISAVDIGQVILDVDARRRATTPADTWRPAHEPSGRRARRRRGRRPGPPADRRSLDAVRTGLARPPAHAPAGWPRRPAAVLAMARTVSRSAPGSPLNAEIGEQRRYATARHRPRRLQGDPQGARRHGQRRRAGGGRRWRCATWLMTRGEAVTPSSQRPRDGAGERARHRRSPAPLGNRVSSYLVDLPVGRAEPGGPAAPGRRTR